MSDKTVLKIDTAIISSLKLLIYHHSAQGYTGTFTIKANLCYSGGTVVIGVIQISDGVSWEDILPLPPRTVTVEIVCDDGFRPLMRWHSLAYKEKD